MYDVPFNRPHTVGTEMRYIGEAVAASHLSANGPFSKRCTTWLEADDRLPRARCSRTRAPARSRWPRCSPTSGRATR